MYLLSAVQYYAWQWNCLCCYCRDIGVDQTVWVGKFSE